MTEIQWEDPPSFPSAEPNIPNRRHAAFAQELRDNPKRWAVHPHTSTSVWGSYALAQRIRSGKNLTFGPGFEAAARKGLVYVRYVGTPDEVEP